jgi:ribonuclease HIII
MVVFTGVKKEKLQKLKEYTLEEPKSMYEELRLKKNNVTLVLYNSGKLLLQGKQESIEEISEDLEKIGIGKKIKSKVFRRETGMIIGSDETLKGDTFGGLVVAGVKANAVARKKLVELGVADSKTLNDKEILVLAERIKRIVSCQIKSITSEEYNHYHKNVTHLLNKLHSEVGNYLNPGKHVVDKYPGCNVGDIQEEKAESKYVEVAAASILARAAALHQLDGLSIEVGFTVPKGSTHVKDALARLKKEKIDFRKFVKLNFSNVRKFL